MQPLNHVDKVSGTWIFKYETASIVPDDQGYLRTLGAKEYQGAPGRKRPVELRRHDQSGQFRHQGDDVNIGRREALTKL